MKIKYLIAITLAAKPLFVQSDQSKKSEFIQYHNRVVLFLPFHQCYERIKNDAFYVAAEAFFVRSKKSHILLNSELRMGYNYFFDQKDHLSPFVGMGHIKDFYFHHHNHLLRLRHKPGVAYGALGFLYVHEFNSVFNLGINGKAILGAPVSKKHFNWGAPVIGVQFTVPITFRFGCHRHWDLRLEPFNLYLHGSKAVEDYSGCITTLGYRF